MKTGACDHGASLVSCIEAWLSFLFHLNISLIPFSRDKTDNIGGIYDALLEPKEAPLNPPRKDGPE